MKKQVTRSCAVFFANACVGIVFQVATSFLIPSLQLAFLDLGVFRTFAGLGLIETLLLAITLAVAAESSFGSTKNEESHSSPAKTLGTGIAVGIVATLLIMYVALRIPLLIAVAWGSQSMLQLASGLVTSSVLRASNPRKALAVALASGTGSSLALVVAYLVPTPLPSASFSVSTQGVGDVTVDCFLPDTPGPYDAVVILHGVEGATNLTCRAIHYPNAKAVSRRGYATFFVRYFEPCPYHDLLIMDADNTLDVAAIEEVRLRDYQKWIAVAQQAIATIRERDDIEQVAVIGYSLGCYVGSAACSELCKQDQPPEAFIGNFGAIWPEVDLPDTFPPTQFYHGEADEVIPLQAVRDSVSRLTALGGNEVSLFTFPYQGHLPQGPASPIMRTSTEAFLARQLGKD